MTEHDSRRRLEFNRKAQEAGFFPRDVDYHIYRAVKNIMALAGLPLMIWMFAWDSQEHISQWTRLLPLALFYLPSWLGWVATRRWPAAALGFRYSLTMMLYLSPFLLLMPLMSIYYHSGHAQRPLSHGQIVTMVSWLGQTVILGLLVWFIVSRGNWLKKMKPFLDATQWRREQSKLLQGIFIHACVLVMWAFCLTVIGTLC